MTRPFLQRVLRAAAALVLGVLVVAVFLNVVLRFVFDSGLLVTEELSRILLVWLVFGAAISVLHAGRHLSMTIVIEQVSRPMQIAAGLAGGALMILCDVLLLLGAWRQLQFSLGDSFAVTGLPAAVIYAPGLLAAGAFIAVTLWRMAQLATGRIGPDRWFSFTAPSKGIE